LKDRTLAFRLLHLTLRFCFVNFFFLFRFCCSCVTNRFATFSVAAFYFSRFLLSSAFFFFCTGLVPNRGDQPSARRLMPQPLGRCNSFSFRRGAFSDDHTDLVLTPRCDPQENT
jgi:hypothetical protein